MTAPRGYYRFPSLHGDRIVFASEDDLWSVSAAGGVAQRLSANPGRASWPRLSPDGKWLAFTSQDEGTPDAYVMPAEGGRPRRLTFSAGNLRVSGWRPDSSAILFASDMAQPFAGVLHLWEIAPEGEAPRSLGLGPSLQLAFEPGGPRRVLWRFGGGRRQGDPAWWKRYRGGTVSQLWIDPRGADRWRPLLRVDGDVAAPMWIGRRVYFLSDFEGVGNLYSCRSSGDDLKRHTDHEEYYARTPTTDGHRIVYTAGADLYLFDPEAGQTRRLDVATPSTRPQRARRFVDAATFLQHYALHPEGHSLCLTSRGRPFSMGHWEGPAVQYGEPDGVRYRLSRFLPDGKRLLAVTDEEGEEQLTVFAAGGSERRVQLQAELGRVVRLEVSSGSRVALTNHKSELWVVELGRREATRLAASRHGAIEGMSWSPDGRWLAFAFPENHNTTALRLWDAREERVHQLTRPDFHDFLPCFDAAGDYLYFLSTREYDPVYDNRLFALGFPRGVRVLAIPLRRELPSPFEPEPRSPAEEPAREPAQPTETPRTVRVDLEAIADRVVAAPIAEGRYDELRVARNRLLFLSHPIKGALGNRWDDTQSAPPADAKLVSYDLREQREETWVDGVSDFELSPDRAVLAYRKGFRLRVLRADKKPGADDSAGPGDAPGRRSGWIDLGRLKVSVDPPSEWRQMFLEAWRLQRDHFWVGDMSGVPWERIRDRYLPLLDRVASRNEFSDLMWETQGELGTSHAYEIGGDYRPGPSYGQGFLGADLSLDPRSGSWRIDRIPSGDSWDPERTSALAAPGVNARERHRILAVDQQRVGRELSPAACLVNRAAQRVQIRLADAAGRNPRTVTVRALASETPLRYRDWVESNRERVHVETDGRVGYLHIPDMGPPGYSEFHRYFLAELDRLGLIVDVRYNGGGHVSQLLLEKLARRRIGYDRTRWMEPESWPAASPFGPMVALTNEHAGSDGDIFSHAFKLYGLGPLIGTRTWGGVIGISPRQALVDRSITTQPEYAFWWVDVGYSVENYGTDPDIEVEFRPQDYAAGRDPQLDRAIREVTRIVARKKPGIPDLSKRPPLPSAKLLRN